MQNKFNTSFLLFCVGYCLQCHLSSGLRTQIIPGYRGPTAQSTALFSSSSKTVSTVTTSAPKLEKFSFDSLFKTNSRQIETANILDSYQTISQISTVSAATSAKSIARTDTAMEGEKEGMMDSMGKLPDSFWKLAMMLVCILWSSNFPVIKLILDSLPDGQLDPPLYLAIRFSIAAVILSPTLIGKLRNPDLILSGAIVGLSIFLGYFGQSIGLMTSTADKSAFICSMQVVWVASVVSVMERVFKAQTWISVALAVAGLALIELDANTKPVVGDLWLLLQPIGFGSGYLLLERALKKYPEEASAITSFKITTVAVCSIVWAILKGHTFDDVMPILQNPQAVGGLLYTSIFTTAFAIWLQSIVFKRVAAQDASLILTSEPLWAALFASVLLGEGLDGEELFGGGLIVVACLFKELNLLDKIVETVRAPTKEG